MTIRLERGEYFELRTRILEVDVLESELKALVAKLAAAKRNSQATFEAIAKAYSFDPTQAYRWEDATCALIPVSGSSTPVRSDSDT